MLKRGQDLDAMANKSEELAEGAAQFSSQPTGLQEQNRAPIKIRAAPRPLKNVAPKRTFPREQAFLEAKHDLQF